MERINGRWLCMTLWLVGVAACGTGSERPQSDPQEVPGAIEHTKQQVINTGGLQRTAAQEDFLKTAGPEWRELEPGVYEMKNERGETFRRGFGSNAAAYELKNRKAELRELLARPEVGRNQEYIRNLRAAVASLEVRELNLNTLVVRSIGSYTSPATSYCNNYIARQLSDLFPVHMPGGTYGYATASVHYLLFGNAYDSGSVYVSASASNGGGTNWSNGFANMDDTTNYSRLLTTTATTPGYPDFGCQLSTFSYVNTGCRDFQSFSQSKYCYEIP